MNDLNINVGSLMTIVITVASFIGAVVAITAYLKKGVAKVVKETIEPLEEEIKTLHKEVNEVKFENCKNYVVDLLSRIERGEEVANDELLRFSENFKLYTDMGGNSYVHGWKERLEAEGKLDHKHMI